MKKLFTAAIALALASNAFAIDNEPEPGLTFQVNGGMSITSMSGTPSRFDLGAKVGATLGIKAEYMLPHALGTYANVGAAWIMKGARNGNYSVTYTDASNVDHTDKATLTWNAHYIQIPLHVGYRYNLTDNLGVYAEFGPYVALRLAGNDNAKVEVDGHRDHSYKEGYFSNIQPTDFGLGLLLGGEFENHYSLNVGLDWGITDLYKVGFREQYVADHPGLQLESMHNFCATITVGYRF